MNKNMISLINYYELKSSLIYIYDIFILSTNYIHIFIYIFILSTNYINIHTLFMLIYINHLKTFALNKLRELTKDYAPNLNAG